jgi:hypothetical protein
MCAANRSHFSMAFPFSASIIPDWKGLGVHLSGHGGLRSASVFQDLHCISPQFENTSQPQRTTPASCGGANARNDADLRQGKTE